MFSNFFINRPIFASVLSIVITMAGGIAVFTLPITQYPDITPPTVEVSASYPGANAQVVADTVAAPIEQQVNGVENMMYMYSQCTNDGGYTLTVTFKVGTDLNIAQVLVQNRVTLAQPILPDLVKRKGVLVKKKSPSVLMIVNLFSPDRSKDSLFLSNYATIQLRDELARLEGIGDITYLGQRDYSMRLWLDPSKMSTRNLTATDIVSAVTQQNAQVAAGQIGQPPVPRGQIFQYTMTTLGRLAESKQFEDMILKADADGRLIRMRDVARTELGALAYDQTCTLDTQPSVALSIYQLPGSNALKTAKAVRTRMEELKTRFPKGLDYAIVYDTTPFITESIWEVIYTLLDAVILVACVVLLFLQNWRSAVIPLVAVPVAIIGTFAVMAAFNFSLNNLTLFGLVLAIGIVVDDAIVVVEAVEHHIENGLSPRAATVKAMSQVSGPVVAVGLVLSAVFIPCAFIAGITGQFFRQFALTIAVSTVISAFNSLTLSPALCAILLKPRQKGKHAEEVLPRHVIALLVGLAGALLLTPYLMPWLDPLRLYLEQQLPEWAALWALRLFLVFPWFYVAGLLTSRWINHGLAVGFRWFNRGFDATAEGYTRTVGQLLRVSVVVLVLYGGLLYLTYHIFTITPTGFIPQQDKGYLLVNVQLPDASSVERTEKVMQRIEKIARETPMVSSSKRSWPTV
ncbi:MAG TPA: efflux RND transporter permease subunit [Gemmataceae bacterium]|nr:efflux RND transporter permease subunit [Gemmataceae bacterium]